MTGTADEAIPARHEPGHAEEPTPVQATPRPGGEREGQRSLPRPPPLAATPHPPQQARMPSPDAAPFWRPALAAACAPCSGIGLARFAYVPLFPAMVAAGWVDGAGAGLLGAANMTGYLLGALTGQPLAHRLGTARTLDLGIALVALAFALCAANLGLWWFMPWRLLAGIAGGILMALAGPATQAVVAPDRRGQAGGIVIGGVGMGIATSAITVPVLVGQGLAIAWLGLA